MGLPADSRFPQPGRACARASSCCEAPERLPLPGRVMKQGRADAPPTVSWLCDIDSGCCLGGAALAEELGGRVGRRQASRTPVWRLPRDPHGETCARHTHMPAFWRPGGTAGPRPMGSGGAAANRSWGRCGFYGESLWSSCCVLTAGSRGRLPTGQLLPPRPVSRERARQPGGPLTVQGLICIHPGPARLSPSQWPSWGCLPPPPTMEEIAVVSAAAAPVKPAHWGPSGEGRGSI